MTYGKIKIDINFVLLQETIELMQDCIFSNPDVYKMQKSQVSLLYICITAFHYALSIRRINSTYKMHWLILLIKETYFAECLPIPFI